MAVPTWTFMDEVTITSIEGRRLRLWQVSDHVDPEEPWSFSAELILPMASASSAVWEYGAGPAPFFRTLADDWRGWEGECSYSSLEGELHLSCRHDGKGLVQVNVTLGTSQPPKWSLSATMTLGAGAHLESIAAEIETLFNA
jgi:hypothetical protein